MKMCLTERDCISGIKFSVNVLKVKSVIFAFYSVRFIKSVIIIYVVRRWDSSVGCVARLWPKRAAVRSPLGAVWPPTGWGWCQLR